MTTAQNCTICGGGNTSTALTFNRHKPRRRLTMRLTFEILTVLVAAGVVGHMLAIAMEWNLHRKK